MGSFSVPRRAFLLSAGTVALAGCSAISSPTTPTPTPIATPTDRPSVAGLRIDQRFRFRNGEADVEFPIRVEFQRPDADGWTPVQVFNVARMGWINVELTGEEEYRIVIEGANGERRSLGLYIPYERGAEHTIVIGGCCVDDFSTEVDDGQ